MPCSSITSIAGSWKSVDSLIFEGERLRGDTLTHIQHGDLVRQHFLFRKECRQKMHCFMVWGSYCINWLTDEYSVDILLNFNSGNQSSVFLPCGVFESRIAASTIVCCAFCTRRVTVFFNTKCFSKMKTVVVWIPFVLRVKTWTRSSQVTIFVWGRPSLSSVHQTGSYWITEHKDNNRRKEGVKADSLFFPSNVHMKATILVFYKRRQLYNCAACYKSENSYRLVMEKCQVLWKFVWACYSNVRETGDIFRGDHFVIAEVHFCL